MDESTFPPFSFPVKDNTYRVIDGDSVEVLLDRGWHDTKLTSLRVNGVDAPESTTRKNLLERAAGRLVTQVTKLWFDTHEGKQLYASSDEKPKYEGRTIGRIWAGSTDNCLNDWLLEQGVVKPYEGGSREWLTEELKDIVEKAQTLLGEDAE